MAEGTTLGNVLQLLKADLGYALTPGVATAQDTELLYRIFSKQNWLTSEYDWPFLKLHWTTVLNTGTRYGAIPVINDISNQVTPINFVRPVLVEVAWNNFWQKVQYGIGSEQYNYVNSDLGNQLSPIQRWQFTSSTTMEIWPIAASSQQLRFTGQRMVTNLYSNPLGVIVAGAGITAANGAYIWNPASNKYEQGIYSLFFNGTSWEIDSNVTAMLYTSLTLAGAWSIGAGAGTGPAPGVLATPADFNLNAAVDLDDQMVMLFVSADVKARMGRKDAQFTAQEATRRMERIRACYPSVYKSLAINSGKMDDARLIRNVPMVVIASGGGGGH